MEAIIQCRDLCKDYGGKVALNSVNLEVFSGRIVGLLGPNGSGKTTLIKLANGLLTPTSGEILIGGVDPAARDYILNTIIGNYDQNAAIVISTHLIADVEPILDDVIFINGGSILLTASVDYIREHDGKSVDALFREVFRC